MWRYSRIAALDLARWHPAVAGDGEAPAGPEIDAALAVVARNGRLELGDGAVELAARGVRVSPASALGEDEARLGGLARGDDPFVALNDAFAPDALVVEVGRGVVLDRPIVIRHHVDDADGAVFPRLVVRVGEGASARVVDHVTSAAAALSVPVTELEVARGGRLAHVHVQELHPDAWQIGNLAGRVDQEGDLTVSLVALGGGYARLRTDVDLVGRGANGDLYAAYFGGGDQTLDFRTFQNHSAPDTTSNLLFKGAVGDRSRSVYTGLIRVDREARGTNAFQTNRNIKLSDDAWAESVPNLEIETNDVRCSHASTVGPVDPEQHFYLESRGVPPEVADRLIVAGFFDEVVRNLPVEALVEPVRAAIDAKLDAVGGVSA